VSTSAQQFSGQTQIHERRAHPRVLPRTLIYVACGESNGGMVLNVSDDGMAISMAIPVGDESYSNLHVRMNGLAQSLEVHGRMAWTTKSKKRAGIQLVDVSDEQRAQIREWLAREGVRDVNLLPRSTGSAAVLPACAGCSHSHLA
jgi:PilZ domain